MDKRAENHLKEFQRRRHVVMGSRVFRSSDMTRRSITKSLLDRMVSHDFIRVGPGGVIEVTTAGRAFKSVPRTSTDVDRDRRAAGLTRISQWVRKPREGWTGQVVVVHKDDVQKLHQFVAGLRRDRD